MRSLLLLSFFIFTPLTAIAAADGRTGNWTEVVDSADGKYSLDYDQGEKRVDVTKLDQETAAPAAVKLRIMRKNGKPLDLKLKTLETPNSPIRYTGQFEDWNGSVMGFEMDMSFDKKTWKKLKRVFGVGGGH
ncbi:MAG: hypothetical protein ACXVB9_12270 [Bdellovibrionota bacterium]